MKASDIEIGLSAERKIQLSVLLLFLVVMGGTLGFTLIEKLSLLDSLYMTVITLSTVGFGEVHPLSPGGRGFAIILIIVGVGTMASLARGLGEQVLEGHFKHLVARRKMEKKLRKMQNHFILAGYGRVGRHVAEEFLMRSVPFVVIERGDAVDSMSVDENLIFIQGDATSDEVLRKAGIDHAKTLVSTLPDEAQNVYLTLTARNMNKKLNIIARADYEEGEKKLMLAGADHVVIPHVIGGIRMAKAALQPNVVDFMQMASLGDNGLLVEEMVVREGSQLVGHTLAESNLKQKYGITIIGVRKQGNKMDINPGAATRLEAADILVVVGEQRDLERLSSDLGTAS